jgi:cytoskeleton protein RodZ
VVDGSGRTLISRRYQAGEVESAVGKLPMSIVVGNAPATKLAYNDVNFDLAPHTKVAVAKVTLK